MSNFCDSLIKLCNTLQSNCHSKLFTTEKAPMTDSSQSAISVDLNVRRPLRFIYIVKSPLWIKSALQTYIISVLADCRHNQSNSWRSVGSLMWLSKSFWKNLDFHVEQSAGLPHILQTPSERKQVALDSFVCSPLWPADLCCWQSATTVWPAECSPIQLDCQ